MCESMRTSMRTVTVAPPIESQLLIAHVTLHLAAAQLSLSSWAPNGSDARASECRTKRRAAARVHGRAPRWRQGRLDVIRRADARAATIRYIFDGGGAGGTEHS